MADPKEIPIDPKLVRVAAEVAKQLQPLLPTIQQASRLIRNYPVTNRHLAEMDRLSRDLRAVGASEGSLKMLGSLAPLAHQVARLRENLTAIQRIWPTEEERPHNIRLLLEGIRQPVGRLQPQAGMARFEPVMAQLDRMNRRLEKVVAEISRYRKDSSAELESDPSCALKDVDLRFLSSPKIKIVRRSRSVVVRLEQKGYLILLHLAKKRRRGNPAEGEDLLRLVRNPNQTREKARNLLGQVIRRVEERLSKAVEAVGGKIDAAAEIIQSRPSSPTSGRRSKRGMHRYLLSIDPKRIVLPPSRTSNPKHRSR
ncbi:MAG: hypothetical protein HY211_01060 [Candidatus Omnitrophica bacterium]|nr:hypothetical protein [Candidatus Omnitrophota bacterium]